MTAAAYLLLEELDQEETADPPAAGPELAAPERQPIWERILERCAAIPDEEWDRLPTDLAAQHDHYLYGTPKRSKT